MKTRQIAIFLLVLSALLLQACGANAQDAIATGVAQTLQISALETALAEAGGLPVQPTTEPSGGGGQPVASSDTPQPSNTPTITLTPTPSIPYVSVSQATNCRSGPGASYTLITTMNVGQQAEVVNVFSNDYVVVRNPNGSGLCWLWLNYANTRDFNAYNLPLATQPPTSTPTFTPTPDWNWNGSWTGYLDLGGGTLDACSMSLSTSGNSISGSYDCGGGLTGTISGSLSNGRQNASGTWSNSFAATGSFDWQIKSGNRSQFIGNYDSSFAWCGARSAASPPSPCYWP